VREHDRAAVEVQVGGTVVEILAYSAAHLYTTLGSHGHIADIKKPVEIRTK
jgi:hypothetical protein